jgi:ribonuclease HI
VDGSGECSWVVRVRTLPPTYDNVQSFDVVNADGNSECFGVSGISTASHLSSRQEGDEGKPTTKGGRVMNILIYSDGSTYRNAGLACSIILTETHYLGLVIQKYEVDTAAETELLSILQSLEYIDQRREKLTADAILVCTDAEYLVLVYDKIMECGYIPKKTKYRSTWIKIVTICKKHNISFIHMASHQKEHNPNKACDIMGRVHRKCGTDMLVQG